MDRNVLLSTVNTAGATGEGIEDRHEDDWGPLSASHPFALCLTHDVDRPYRSYQPLYYAVKERDPKHLLELLSGDNPYWLFEKVMEVERELGVRSVFNFLNEQNLFRDKPIRSWFRPKNWKLYVGRYSLENPAIVEIIHTLDADGWEIGLHGSYGSYNDRERLRREKEALEAVLGSPVVGGRQHYLNLEVPRTWRYQVEIGLGYDTSLGSNTEYGFQFGHSIYRPFDDEFVVFPLTVMEFTLPDVGTDSGLAWRECERLLVEARENRGVMTVLWHPRYFNEEEHPGYVDLYRRLVARALEMGAWVGPPGELYATLEHPSDTDGGTDTLVGRDVKIRTPDRN